MKSDEAQQPNRKASGPHAILCNAPASSGLHWNTPAIPATGARLSKVQHEKSHLEDYLMVVLGLGATHPDATVNLDTLVRRRLEKNLRLKRELAAGNDASGGTTIPFDYLSSMKSRYSESWRISGSI